MIGYRGGKPAQEQNMRKVFFVVAILMVSPAWGASSGGDIFASCASAPGTEGYAKCNSYINGFVGGILVDQISNEQGTPICIPDNTTTDQVREVIMRYAKTNPEALRVISNSFVGAALLAAYSCKKSN